MMLAIKSFAADISGRTHGDNRKGVCIGLRGSYNTTWLLNKDIENKQGQNYAPSFGNKFGAGILYNFIEQFGISAEILLNNHRQMYGDDQVPTNWSDEIRLKYL